MKTYQLKTWKQFYQSVVDGSKKFEIRQNDRNFQVGDILELVEVDEYRNLLPTGRSCQVRVTYLYRGSRNNAFGLKDGHVVMSIERLEGETDG
jgi:hypothetical protein